MENMTTKLSGFYVEGKYYGTKFAQAAGRAAFLAAEHKRGIDINFCDHLGREDVKLTVFPYRAPEARMTAPEARMTAPEVSAAWNLGPIWSPRELAEMAAWDQTCRNPACIPGRLCHT
jgi:hypothetical protein